MRLDGRDREIPPTWKFCFQVSRELGRNFLESEGLTGEPFASSLKQLWRFAGTIKETRLEHFALYHAFAFFGGR
jgi:hypothetical protein